MSVVLDGGDPASVRAAVAEVVGSHGRIDILVNNAGSAGPKQPIETLPLTTAELAAGDSETVAEAARSLLGVAWNLVRACGDALPPGASVINVSTIFSRTEYYARAAYTVPKAALNALSRTLAHELGPRGIRVNLLFPGPIESARIRTVFAAMDALQGKAAGATAEQFTGIMALARGGDAARPLPAPADIANACVFLGSDESAALSGQEIEVTHGMAVPKESRSTYLSRPTMRSIDGAGLGVVVVAGADHDSALELAHVLAQCGAAVLVGVAPDTVAELTARLDGLPGRIAVAAFDRADAAGMDAALAAFTAGDCEITGAVVLPALGFDALTGPLATASDAAVDAFIDTELAGAVAVARTLSRYWKLHDSLVHDPRVVFMGHGPGDGDAWGTLLAAGITELIRVWRDESAVDVAAGRRRQAEWGNQIVRLGNAEPENLRFAAGQAARILLKERRVQPIDLHLPESIGESTGARVAMVGFAENITGLHLGKVALITGGSAGIGGQVARLLALAGAKVMLVARRESELQAMRARIVGELEDVGFSGVERRVRTLSNIDVADHSQLEKCVDATIAAFGRIDYLINNAGVSGAEEMVVDMDIAAWRRTLDANLISNYVLMHHVVPRMKAQGSGYILNVSSYFGGEKYLAVAYPNRADYAVSKAGQRALVESTARYLGPEIQINAIAPGPVDGDRLGGTGGKPGLFERRGRLILENKRLNATYAACIKAMRRGVRVEAVLARLSRNDTVRIAHDTDNPRELRELALACAQEGDDTCTWDRFVLTREIAARLVKRLRSGGHFRDAGAWSTRPDTDEANGGWLLRVPPDDKPWLPPTKVASEAKKVGGGVTSLLNLGRMPTEGEVAQATVFFLADRAVSGETFMPSGGLSLERSTTERELFGSPKQERLDRMRGKTVWLVGEHLAEHLAEVASAFGECGIGRIVLVAATAEGGEAVRAAAGDAGLGVPFEVVVAGTDLEIALDDALTRWGAPTTVVSTPFAALPDTLFGDDPLPPAGFAQLCEDQLTHHFRVARKASLYDQCQLVLVTPDVPMGGSRGPGFALANFIKTSLHAFTATLAVENERLVHDVPVNQINLTRRVAGEEPRDLEEHLEEVRRFARAVLLAGAPLPDAEDSRYRARIYRGMSMTV